MNQDDRERYQWTSVDAQAWKELLLTDTGKKLLRALVLEKPELLAKGETNDILIRSGEARQHDNLTAFLLTLTGVDTEIDDDPSQESTYPSLTDDTAWEGDKLHDADNPKNTPTQA
jgi:hypothetical protein